MCAGSRKVLKGGKRTGVLGKRAARGSQGKVSKGLHRLKTCKKRAARQAANEYDGELPVVSAPIDSGQRILLSGPARVVMMRSNKSFKPGD